MIAVTGWPVGRCTSTLGLPLDGGPGGYVYREGLAGIGSFGIWPLAQAAQACFGTDEWPAERPVPQVSIEFDLADTDAVSAAAEELERSGHVLLHGPRTEPWGQTVARLQSPEGAVVGLTFTPVLHG